MSFDDLVRSGPQPIDGGLASELEARGHDLADALWSARILVDAPEEIVAVHRAYVEQGARVVVTASYQVSRDGFAASGREPATADAALARSVELGRRAVAGSSALVAASVGPYGAILHDGSEYRGRYRVSEQRLVDFHGERLAVLAQAGPDLFAVETIPDADEVRALVRVLADFPDIPAWLTLSCADGATTNAGQPVEDAVLLAAACPSIRAVGVNCTAPQYVAEILARMSAVTDLALVAYPNSGRSYDPATGWAGPARALADEDIAAWSAYASLIGGCCGIGPADIGRLSAALATR